MRLSPKLWGYVFGHKNYVFGPKNLVFGPKDPSHMVDLAENIIFVCLIIRFFPQAAPKMIGMLVSSIPIILGGGFKAISLNKKRKYYLMIMF